MSSRQNLNDNVSDRYEFSVGGLDYDLIYPTLTEIREIQDLVKESQKLDKDESLDAKEKEKQLDEIQKKTEKVMYSFIKPVGHNTPIEQTLEKQSLKVVNNFNNMLTKQFSE